MVRIHYRDGYDGNGFVIVGQHGMSLVLTTISHIETSLVPSVDTGMRFSYDTLHITAGKARLKPISAKRGMM